MNLFEKIQSVSNEIKNITKDMVVGSGQYSYKAVSDIQVTLAVKEAEQKYKLISIPVKQDLISSEIVKTVKKNGDEGITYVDNIKMTVKIIDLEKPSEFIEVESFGKGIDSGDKGFGKASTYARKVALLNAYKIATGEDPDAEASKEETSPKTISDKRKLVSDYYNLDNKLLLTLFDHFSVATMDDLTEKQINEIYATLKKKGKI